jgi:hypothetical protein
MDYAILAVDFVPPLHRRDSDAVRAACAPQNNEELRDGHVSELSASARSKLDGMADRVINFATTFESPSL